MVEADERDLVDDALLDWLLEPSYPSIRYYTLHDLLDRSKEDQDAVAARKAVIELLLAGHTGPCVSDQKAQQCELH